MNPQHKLIIELIWYAVVVVTSATVVTSHIPAATNGSAGDLLWIGIGMLAFYVGVESFSSRWRKL